jgi:predicted enzyme related to lactoylglutathione lyase
MFGWEKTSEMDMGGSMYLMFGMNGKPFGGMSTRKTVSFLPPSWLYYVNVRDAKSATAAIARGGGKVTQGPMRVPGGDWIATASDPQGTTFAVHQSPAKSVAPTSAKAAAGKPRAKAKPMAAKKPKAKAKASGKKKTKTVKKTVKKAVKKTVKKKVTGKDKKKGTKQR